MFSTIDFETTGLNLTLDEICEVAVVNYDKDFKIEKEFRTLCKTFKPIPEDVSAIHGITNEMVEHMPYFHEVIPTVLQLIKGKIICGQNIRRFDLPLLAEKCLLSDFPFDISEYRTLDTLVIESVLKPRNLSYLYKQYTGKDLDDAHSALADCKASMEVLKAQIETHNLDIHSADFNFAFGIKDDLVDPLGKLKYIDGEICWAMGKCKDQPVIKDPSYARWALTADFPKSTKFYIQKELDKIDKVK
jgi:DNA polymerase-3 subunit epsilon